MLDDILDQLGIFDIYLKKREALYAAQGISASSHDKSLEEQLARWAIGELRTRAKSASPETQIFRLEEVQTASALLDAQAKIAEQEGEIKAYQRRVEQLQQDAAKTAESDVMTLLNVLRSVYQYHNAVTADGGKTFEERLKRTLPNDLIVGRIRDFMQIPRAAPLPIDDDTRMQMLMLWPQLCAFVQGETAQMAARAEDQETTLTQLGVSAREKTDEVRQAYDSLEDTLVMLLNLGKKRDELDEQIRTTRRKTRTAKFSADDLDWRRNMMLDYVKESLTSVLQNIHKDKADWQAKESAYSVKIAELEQKLKRGALSAAQAAQLREQITDFEAALAKARQDQGLGVLDTVKQIYTGYARMVLKKQGEEQGKEVKNPLVSSFLNRAQQAASPEAWETVVAYLFPPEGQEFDPALADKAVDDKLAALAREEVGAITDKLYRSFVAVERANAQQNADRRKYAAELKERDAALAAAQKELGEVQDGNSTLTLEYHAEKEKRKQAENEIAGLQEQIASINKEYEKLSASMQETTQSHRKTAAEKTHLVDQFTALEARVRAVSEDLAQSQERAKQLETQNTELEKRFARQRDYLTKTEGDLAKARDEVAAQQSSFDDKQRAYVALERRAAMLESDLKYANEQNALLQQNIASAERNYQKLEQEKAAIEQESERRNRLLHDTAAEGLRQKGDYETRCAEYARLLAEAQSEVRDAMGRENAVREEILRQLGENNAAMGKERNAIEAKLNEVASREKQLDLARVGLETREKQLYATVDGKMQEYKRFIAIGKELVKLNNQKAEQLGKENGILRAVLAELKPETPKPYAGGY
jgi:hypothetical protein